MDDTKQLDISHQMMKLSSKLDIILPLLKGELVYIDYPVHWNIGDLLIWKGAQEFFKRNKKTFLSSYSINNLSQRALKHMDKCATICLHGGGNLGDLWPHHQRFREQIIQKYPHKRIIILPQSVHFDEMLEFDKASAIIKEHPDLHIFARDKQSFALLHHKGIPNITLCPDMAHALWGKISAPKPKLPHPLHLRRRDKEDNNIPAAINSLNIPANDWQDVLTGFTKHAYKFGDRLDKIDGQRENKLPAFIVWNIVSKLLINRGIDLFAPYKTVITNRLHAVILASLMKRNVIAYDNSYGKISSYIDCWMSDFPNIELHSTK